MMYHVGRALVAGLFLTALGACSSTPNWLSGILPSSPADVAPDPRDSGRPAAQPSKAMRLANAGQANSGATAGTVGTASSGLRDVPVLGSIMVALLGPGGPEQDSEMAVDAKAADPPQDTLGAAAPPRINMLYVRKGVLRAYGPALVIRGTIDNEAPIVDVSVNGQPAQYVNRGFARRIAVPLGESEAMVRVEDADGNVVVQKFLIARSSPGQGLAAARVTSDMIASDYKFAEAAAPERAARLEDQTDPGVYMVLLAGTPSAHIIRMNSMAQCREAVAYTENAACTFYPGAR
jgi:hypothetical protein